MYKIWHQFFLLAVLGLMGKQCPTSNNHDIAMKLFLSLVLCGFCQFAFGAASVTSSNSQISATCSISDATISKISITSTRVTYKFTHSVRLSIKFLSGFIVPECFIQISTNTQTNKIVGGWKFEAASLNDINFSVNNLGCGRVNVSNTQNNYAAPNGQRIKSVSFQDDNSAGNCQLSYSITLVADPNSFPGTNTLSPLINMGLEDARDASGFAKSVANISIGSQTPDPSPQSTCSLSVPSNLSLGNAKLNDWNSIDTKRVNATNFDIAVNCSQKLATTFTPKVTMRFEKPLGTSCLANNELTSAADTDATIEIIRVVQGTAQPICPTTVTPFTTLAFKVYDPASTQLYSDIITLQAAFRGASGNTRPKTGPFSTRATFTVKYE
jgi:hypothetical protein